MAPKAKKDSKSSFGRNESKDSKKNMKKKKKDMK